MGSLGSHKVINDILPHIVKRKEFDLTYQSICAILNLQCEIDPDPKTVKYILMSAWNYLCMNQLEKVVI